MESTIDILDNIPEKYKILSHTLKFRTDYWNPSVPVYVLSPVNCSVASWYRDFEDSVIRIMEQRKHLPVLRASDGEFRFLLGPQMPSTREAMASRIRLTLKYYYERILSKKSGFTGQTAPGVSVGNYSSDELARGRLIFARGLRYVLESGLLAAHLQFTPKPFQECYHAAFKDYLDSNSMALHALNYVPFYFVYLFLSRIATSKLIEGRKVLFINGANEVKRTAINQQFLNYGVKETRWITLSKDRSLFDKISLTDEDRACDLCILGGGVGKFNLIQQMASFPGPVIDAGYYFEAWANPNLASQRPLCIVA